MGTLHVGYQSTTRQPEVTTFFDNRTLAIQYVVARRETGACAVIDPVLDYDEKSGSVAMINANAILSFVAERGYRAAYVLDTHPHADRFSAADYLKRRTGAPHHWRQGGRSPEALAGQL